MNGKQPKSALTLLERAMGVAQHHDAVSGTEKQHVAYDYAKRVAAGVDSAGQLAANLLAAATVVSSTSGCGWYGLLSPLVGHSGRNRLFA